MRCITTGYGNIVPRHSFGDGTPPIESISVTRRIGKRLSTYGPFIDDKTPYGGGAGMLMQAQPIYDCYKAIEEKIAVAKSRLSGDTKICCTRYGNVMIRHSLGKPIPSTKDITFLRNL